MATDLETLERRYERAPKRFVRGVVVATAGALMLIASNFVSPAFQHGPGRGETATPEQQELMDEPMPVEQKVLLIGAGILILPGALALGVGAYQMGGEYERRISEAQERLQAPPPAAA